MGEKILTPLNVWEVLIHPYSLSTVGTIMLRILQGIIWECGLFTTRQVVTFNLTPTNLHSQKFNYHYPRVPNKLPPRTACLLEQAEHHNLPLDIVVNGYMAIPEARTIPIIIINTNRFNVWVRQPLIAAKLDDVEYNMLKYKTTIDWEGQNIKIGFQPVPPQLIDINSCQVEAGPIQPTSPKIGPRSDTGSTSFDFKSVIDQLSFQLNIGKEANLTWVQYSHLINHICDKKEVFSSHDEDLGYCAWLKTLYQLWWTSLSICCTIQYPCNYRVKYTIV